MCIRDSSIVVYLEGISNARRFMSALRAAASAKPVVVLKACLLYTSDAADERSSVDLGGRRIIKKKIKHERGGGRIVIKTECEKQTEQASDH